MQGDSFLTPQLTPNAEVIHYIWYPCFFTASPYILDYVFIQIEYGMLLNLVIVK